MFSKVVPDLFLTGDPLYIISASFIIIYFVSNMIILIMLVRELSIYNYDRTAYLQKLLTISLSIGILTYVM